MNSRNEYPSRTPMGQYIHVLLPACDIALVNLLFWITTLIWPHLNVSAYRRELWLLVNVCYIPVMVWFARTRSYHRAIVMENVVLGAFQAVGIHALFFFSLLTFLHISQLRVGIYLTFYGMMVVAMPLWWTISRQIIKLYRRRGRNFERVVIIGTGRTATRLYDEMMSDAGFGYRVLGFFGSSCPEGFKGKYLGDLSGLDAFVKDNKVDEIFYTLSGEDTQSLTTAVKIADNNVVQFLYVPQIPRLFSRSFELQNVGAAPVMTIRHNPLKSVLNRGIKRAFDFGFSSVVLLFSPLVFVPVAIAIKMSSPGPVFFRQERTGYRGRSFMCYKFRTMRVNADSDKCQATKDDPRKTRLGDFLRKTSIDELPQFINVWKGDMSVVGPRPHMLRHTIDYSKIIDRYMVRHAVKPGITGWAQVNGYRGLTDELWKMERRVEYDVWYIENWSFFLDLKIVVRTVINAVQGEKNAF